MTKPKWLWKGELPETVGPYEAAERSVQLLLSIGFELRYVSLKSEARYYGLPGNPNQIRVACHKSDNHVPGFLAAHGFGKTLARITFPENKGNRRPAEFPAPHVENATATAVGLYLLRSAGAAAYTGRTRFLPKESKRDD